MNRAGALLRSLRRGERSGRCGAESDSKFPGPIVSTWRESLGYGFVGIGFCCTVACSRRGGPGLFGGGLRVAVLARAVRRLIALPPRRGQRAEKRAYESGNLR